MQNERICLRQSFWLALEAMRAAIRWHLDLPKDSHLSIERLSITQTLKSDVGCIDQFEIEGLFLAMLLFHSVWGNVTLVHRNRETGGLDPSGEIYGGAGKFASLGITGGNDVRFEFEVDAARRITVTTRPKSESDEEKTDETR